VWGGLGDVVKNIWSGITGFVKGGINGIIDLINGLVNGINSVAGVASKLSGGAVNLHVDKLPHLADGATVLPRPGGTIALLGEAGRAESVVDTGKFNSLMDMVLNTFPKALNAVAGASVGGSGNGATAVGGPGTVVHNENHFPVPAGVDPAAIAQEYVNRAAEKVGLGAAA
jgi:phage-related protein